MISVRVAKDRSASDRRRAEKQAARPLTEREWRNVVEQYRRQRDLEHPESMRAVTQLRDELRHDARTLYRTALRLQADVEVDVLEPINLADYTASSIRRRLASRHDELRLRFTEGVLDDLAEEITLKPTSLRSQAWWLDVAAEMVQIWIEVYLARREALRGRARGRAPSVGLDFLIRATLAYGPSEIADRLLDAGVHPEREAEDHDDPRAQWMNLLKRARTRHRQRPEK